MTGANSTSRRAPRIGDVYFVRLIGTGSEQSGLRPCLIISNNKGNLHSPTLIVLPLTSSLKRLDLPTHVYLPAAETGLKKNSVVLCENPECISKERLGAYITTLPQTYMEEVARSYLIATSVISYLDQDAVYRIWSEAIRLNVA